MSDGNKAIIDRICVLEKEVKELRNEIEILIHYIQIVRKAVRKVFPDSQNYEK